MRRQVPIMAVLATVALAMAAMAPGALAQDESAAEAHPLVGAWMVNSDPEDLIVFETGGAIINLSPGAAAIGTWEPTGEGTADFALHFISATPGEGTWTIRGSLEVAADGTSLNGTYTFEPSPEIAANFGMEPGELGPGEVTAQRIVAEPMGEPIGPLPDFDAPPPGDQDMSPAPEGSPSSDELPTVVPSPEPMASPAG